MTCRNKTTKVSNFQSICNVGGTLYTNNDRLWAGEKYKRELNIYIKLITILSGQTAKIIIIKRVYSVTNSNFFYKTEG